MRVVKDNVLIDGRNRRAACKIAGIEPEVIELNGEDIFAYIISSNVVKRRITKGQSAMGVAMVHREAHSKGLDSKQFSKTYLLHARLILNHSENLAKQVMAGKSPDFESNGSEEVATKKKPLFPAQKETR